MIAQKLTTLLLLASSLGVDGQIWSHYNHQMPDRSPETPCEKPNFVRNNGLFAFSSGNRRFLDPLNIWDSRSPYQSESENTNFFPSSSTERYSSYKEDFGLATEYPSDDWEWRRTTVEFDEMKASTESPFDPLVDHSDITTSGPLIEANTAKIQEDDVFENGSLSHKFYSNQKSNPESEYVDSSSLKQITDDNEPDIPVSNNFRKASFDSSNEADDDSPLNFSNRSESTLEQLSPNARLSNGDITKTEDLISHSKTSETLTDNAEPIDQYYPNISGFKLEADDSSGWGSGFSPELSMKELEEFSSGSGNGEINTDDDSLTSAGKNRNAMDKQLQYGERNNQEQAKNNIMVIENNIKSTNQDGITSPIEQEFNNDEVSHDKVTNESSSSNNRDSPNSEVHNAEAFIIDVTESTEIQKNNSTLDYTKLKNVHASKSPFIMTIKASKDKNSDWETKKTLEAEGFVSWNPSLKRSQDAKINPSTMTPYIKREFNDEEVRNTYEGSGTSYQYENKSPVVHQKRSENSSGNNYKAYPLTKITDQNSDQDLGKSSDTNAATPMLFLLASSQSKNKANPFETIPKISRVPSNKVEFKESESVKQGLPTINRNNCNANKAEMQWNRERRSGGHKRSRGEQLVSDLLESLRDTAIDIASNRPKRRPLRKLSISNIAKGMKRSF